MEERDEKILRHIGRYRLSIRPVIEQLFFEGKDSDHVLQRLLTKEYIRAHGPLPGNFSYYQLTMPTALRLNFPKNRAEVHKERALREALAVLWFCCMNGKQRQRLLAKEVEKFVSAAELEGLGLPHCAERPGYLYHRIYAPSQEATDARFVNKVFHQAELALGNEQLSTLIHAERYFFTVLAETPQRLQRLSDLLTKDPPVSVPLHFEIVPGAYGLAEALKRT